MPPSAFHNLVHQDPTFGYDPWLNLAAAPTFQPDLSTQLLAGADTLAGDIGLLPAGLPMYASYVDGYGGYSELVSRFSHSGAFLLSISVSNNRARCGDFEPGAMVNEQAGAWLDSLALGDSVSPPWVYTSAGNMQALNAHIGSRKVVRWSAHYGTKHICGPSTCGFPQADWTQWADHGPNGENFDQSIGFRVPSTPPKPPPPPPGVDPMSLAVAQNKDGSLEVFCEAQPVTSAHCGQVFHIKQDATQLGWWEKPDGSPNWLSLGTPGA